MCPGPPFNPAYDLLLHYSYCRISSGIFLDCDWNCLYVFFFFFTELFYLVSFPFLWKGTESGNLIIHGATPLKYAGGFFFASLLHALSYSLCVFALSLEPYFAEALGSDS